MVYTLWESGSINGSIDTGFTGSLIYWTVQSNGQWVTQVSSSESRQMDSDSLPILRFQMQFCEVTFILGFFEFLKWIHCPFFVAWLEVALLACFICSFFSNKQLRKKHVLWKLDGFHTVSCVVFVPNMGHILVDALLQYDLEPGTFQHCPRKDLQDAAGVDILGETTVNNISFSTTGDANSFAGFSWNRVVPSLKQIFWWFTWWFSIVVLILPWMSGKYHHRPRSTVLYVCWGYYKPYLVFKWVPYRTPGPLKLGLLSENGKLWISMGFLGEPLKFRGFVYTKDLFLCSKHW